MDRLVASAVLGLEQQLLQRLAAGEHVAVPVLLQETPNSRLQQMPDGLGSQVSNVTEGTHSGCMQQHGIREVNGSVGVTTELDRGACDVLTGPA